MKRNIFRQTKNIFSKFQRFYLKLSECKQGLKCFYYYHKGINIFLDMDMKNNEASECDWPQRMRVLVVSSYQQFSKKNGILIIKEYYAGIRNLNYLLNFCP